MWAKTVKCQPTKYFFSSRSMWFGCVRPFEVRASNLATHPH